MKTTPTVYCGLLPDNYGFLPRLQRLPGFTMLTVWRFYVSRTPGLGEGHGFFRRLCSRLHNRS